MEKQPPTPTIERYQNLLRYSEAGRMLAENPPRFSSWHWDDHERMKFYFGRDLDNLEHGAHQAEVIALPMIDAQYGEGYQSFSYDEATALVVTHIFHDAHEGITGDKPAPDKTDDWLHYELAVNREVLEPILEPELIDKVHDVMSDLNGETFAGRAFKAGELCGYFLTGLRAWELRLHPELMDYEKELCADMAKIVCLHDWPIIKACAAEFAFCQQLVDASAGLIDEMRHHQA